MTITNHPTDMVERENPEQDNLCEHLQEYFEDAGGHIEVDEQFRSLYNLDFTLTRFEDVHAHVNLGVRVTARFDDLDQIDRFMQTAKRGIALKALYIEMSGATVDSGGMLVAFGACLSYLFDRRYANSKAMGLRIHEDCSYQFFDLDESVQRLQRMAYDEDLQVGDQLQGKIIAYFTDKGFGFIQTQDERKFFFHIANVLDDPLRSRLPTYVPGEMIDVEFQYGGNDGKKYPKAIQVHSIDEDVS